MDTHVSPNRAVKSRSKHVVGIRGTHCRCRVVQFALVSMYGLATLSWVGCATHTATINSYVDPTYRSGQIQSIAIFPIRNARMAPGEAQQINRRVSVFINRRDPEIRLVSAVEAVNRLNENGLASAWAVFLDNYVSSGVPDVNVLAQIGEAVGADAIIQGEILNVFQQDGADGQKGVTRVTVRFTMLDCQNGKMAWEATSDGRRETAIAGEMFHAPPIIEAIYLAVDKVLETLPL